MPKCLLDTCCCCIDLKIGSFIIGYMDLLGTLCFMWPLSLVPENMKKLQVNGTTVSGGIWIFSNRSGQVRIPESLGYDVMITWYTLHIVRLIVVIALLLGLYTDKRKPVAAYLIYNVIYLVALVIFFVVSVGIVFKVVNFFEIMGLFIGAVITIVCLIIFLVPFNYFWWVILSQYYKMNSINDQSSHQSSASPPSARQTPHRSTSKTTNL